MIISDVKTYLPWGGPRAETIVKVETDSGLEGWGCSGMSAREWAVEGAVRHFRDFLIGRDPMQIGALWQELYRSQYFEGGRVLTAAISAIDIALYDLKGKALGVPVYELLGGKHRDFVPGLRHRFRAVWPGAGRRCPCNSRRRAGRPSGWASAPPMPVRMVGSSNRASRSALPRSGWHPRARSPRPRRRCSALTTTTA